MSNKVRSVTWLGAVALLAALVPAGLIFAQDEASKAADIEQKQRALQAEKDAAKPAAQPAKANIRKVPQNPRAAGNNRTIQQSTAKAKPKSQTPAPTVQLKPGETPAIQFDMVEYDFGKVRSGQNIEHDFWFTNPGTGPLEILSVKPS